MNETGDNMSDYESPQEDLPTQLLHIFGQKITQDFLNAPERAEKYLREIELLTRKHQEQLYQTQLQMLAIQREQDQKQQELQRQQELLTFEMHKIIAEAEAKVQKYHLALELLDGFKLPPEAAVIVQKVLGKNPV